MSKTSRGAKVPMPHLDFGTGVQWVFQTIVWRAGVFFKNSSSRLPHPNRLNPSKQKRRFFFLSITYDHARRSTVFAIVRSDDVGKQTRPRVFWRNTAEGLPSERRVTTNARNKSKVCYVPGVVCRRFPTTRGLWTRKLYCRIVAGAHDESRVPVGEKRPSLGGAVTIIL